MPSSFRYRAHNEKTTRIERNNIGTIANSLEGILLYEEISTSLPGVDRSPRAKPLDSADGGKGEAFLVVVFGIDASRVEAKETRPFHERDSFRSPFSLSLHLALSKIRSRGAIPFLHGIFYARSSMSSL